MTSEPERLLVIFLVY